EKDSPRELYVLANDSDPDGDPLRVESAADPAHGSAAVAVDGQSVRYTPDPGYLGPDSFTYLVSDGLGGESSAKVSIAVRDKIAPRVRSLSPVHRGRGVSPSANVSATFSERMRSSTLNGTTVKLVRRGTTRAVWATVRYDVARQRVVLDPRRALVRGASYTARVTRGARDLAGNPLYAAKTWSFTVRK
ncbi:MAG: Ig-like domain-containing protein, partial [Actinomycetota bacterium]|nr:Ig-like domain-containing protein [Actinomycetota bacterium]